MTEPSKEQCIEILEREIRLRKERDRSLLSMHYEDAVAILAHLRREDGRDDREAVMQDCWNAVDALIVRGQLDAYRSSERNGLVMATNAIMALICEERLAAPIEAESDTHGSWIDVGTGKTKVDGARVGIFCGGSTCFLFPEQWMEAAKLLPNKSNGEFAAPSDVPKDAGKCGGIRDCLGCNECDPAGAAFRDPAVRAAIEYKLLGHACQPAPQPETKCVCRDVLCPDMKCAIHGLGTTGRAEQVNAHQPEGVVVNREAIMDCITDLEYKGADASDLLIVARKLRTALSGGK